MGPGCQGLSPQSCETASGTGHAPAAVALIAGGCFPETWEGPGSSDLMFPLLGEWSGGPGTGRALNEGLPHVLSGAVTGDRAQSPILSPSPPTRGAASAGTQRFPYQHQLSSYLEVSPGLCKRRSNPSRPQTFTRLQAYGGKASGDTTSQAVLNGICSLWGN